MNNTTREHLLYADVIENDGRPGREMTFLGSALAITLGAAVGVALLFAACYLFAAL